MQSSFLYSAVLFATTAAQVAASQIAYDFSGFVAQAISAPYPGVSVANGALVNGRFTYELTSTQTHVLAHGVGYHQQIVNGFRATIGSVTVRADEYLIEVADDVIQSNGSTADSIGITFSSNASPALGSQLSVNSVGRETGFFSVAFVGGSNLWSGLALPTSITANQFPSKVGLFSDTPTGLVDVLFLITNVTMVEVPEPTAALPFALGMVAVVVQWYRSRRKQAYAAAAQSSQQ